MSLINKQKVFNYFKSKFDLKESTKGWYRFPDPIAGDTDLSMAVSFQFQLVKGFKTGYKDFCINFIMLYEDCSYIEALNTIDEYEESEFIVKLIDIRNVTCQYPPHFHSLLSKTHLGLMARNYLRSRRMKIRTLNNMGFGYCDDGDFKGYIIIPFNTDGALKYYIGRDFTGNKIKYRNPETEAVGIGKSELFFNEDALQLYDEVTLTEGWSCAMTWGENAIASLGWALSPMQKSKIIKSKIKRLNIISDPGFYEKALLTAYELYEYIDSVYVVQLDSLGDDLDLNALGKRKVERQLMTTKKFNPSMIFN